MNRWSSVALAALILSFGAVPVTAADAPKAASAAKAPNGKPVFTKYKCQSCHSIEAQGIAMKADPAEKEEGTSRRPPDLSGVGVKRGAAWIEAYLLKKEAIETRKHMKKFRGTEAELKTLAGWLESMKDEKAAAKMEQNEKAAAKADQKENPKGAD